VSTETPARECYDRGVRPTIATFALVVEALRRGCWVKAMEVYSLIPLKPQQLQEDMDPLGTLRR